MKTSGIFLFFALLAYTSARNLKADPITDEELLALSKELHAADVNGAVVELDLQGQTVAGSQEDLAPGRLIVSDPTSYFSLPTYAAAQGLLNNFQKNVTIQETLTASQVAEQDRFLDAIMETTVMQLIHQFLAGKGYVTADVAEFKAVLNQIWFGRWSLYVSGVESSSGWEHYAVGERIVDTNTIVGYHSWLYLFNEEEDGDTNYLGYIKAIKTSTTTIVSMPVFLYGSTKAHTEFEIGASPELDIAMGTMCFFARPEDTPCNVQGADETKYTYVVGTVEYNGFTYIKSAHPVFL